MWDISYSAQEEEIHVKDTQLMLEGEWISK